jgi:hypothetical protein
MPTASGINTLSLMKRYGLCIAVAVAALLVGCGPTKRTWLEWEGPLPRPTSSGEVLSPVGLNASDHIRIEASSSGSRTWHIWQFEITGGPKPSLTVFDAGTGDEPSGASLANPIKVSTFALSAADCLGISELIDYYRHADPVRRSTVTDRVHIEYFRDQKKIGDEQMTEQSWGLDGLVYDRDHPESGHSVVDRRITKDIVSFQQLFQRAWKEVNQSADSTTSAGTSAAEQPRVPASAASHL